MVGKVASRVAGWVVVDGDIVVEVVSAGGKVEVIGTILLRMS